MAPGPVAEESVMVSRNKQNFEFTLGKIGLILFTVCMSLLLFVVFLFGVLVGRNMDTYPERYSRGIPALVKDKLGFISGRAPSASAVRQGTKEAAPNQGEDVDFTFYDTLAGKKGEAKVPTPVTPKGPEGPGQQPDGIKPGVAVAPAGGQLPGSPREGDVKQKVPAPVPPAPVSEAAKELKPPSGGKYLIQAASYQQKEKAESLGKKIAALGYTPRVVMTDIQAKGRWFRVMIGGFESRPLAEKAAGVVEQKIGGLKCTIRAVNGKNN
jgi:cell division septation protein DedD